MEEKMKKICDMQNTLICALECHMEDLSKLDTKEAGEVIDMIKDLSEANYYNSKILHNLEKEKVEEMENHYKEYLDARKCFMESHTEHDKREMESHAKSHLSSTLDTIRDIWRDAEPQLRQQVRENLQKLINEMA